MEPWPWEWKGRLSKETSKTQPVIIRHHIFEGLHLKQKNYDSEHLKNREIKKKNHTCNPKTLTKSLFNILHMFSQALFLSQFFDVIVMMVYVQSLALHLMASTR